MRKLNKMLSIFLTLGTCMAFAFGCGGGDKVSDQSSSSDIKEPEKPAGITIGEWNTYDKDNIKNIVTSNGVTSFSYTMISKASYKNVFAVVSGHDKEKNICTINITNTGSKEMNVQIAVEDEAGAADWQDPDTAVYGEVNIPAGETVDAVAYLYTGKNGDVDVFTGTAYQVKVFPDSGNNSKSSTNGSVKINSVTFTKGEVPVPEEDKPVEPEVTDPDVTEPETTEATLELSVAQGSEEVITLENGTVTFTYDSDPVNKYKSIKFTPSNYDKSKYNSVRFKVTLNTEGNNAEKTVLVLGYKCVWDTTVEGYGSNLEVKEISTEQIFNQDYLWGSAGETVTTLNYIELFVNSNAQGISETLTGSFTITAEFYNKA